jgi:AAA15 family ATPase/GTPase
MKLDFRKSLRAWNPPVFKVLANNDTANAPGHQGGIVIPSTLRWVFPKLINHATSDNPTIDHRIDVELYAETTHLGDAKPRYQYQTWGGARSPESRVTDQLGPLRKRAAGGDILIIQKSRLDSNRYRFTLVTAKSASFAELKKLAGKRRWGNLYENEEDLNDPYTNTKLLFIWVRNYKNLNNFSLNLSSDIKFTYDAAANAITHTACSPLPKDFFPDRITDVVALIGKNGAGKSNALELVCNVLKGSKNLVFSDFVVITQTDDEKRFKGYYRLQNQTTPTGKGISFVQEEGSIAPLNVVFFSNIYDERRNNFDKEVIDLSVNGKIVGSERQSDHWDYAFLDQTQFLDSEYFKVLAFEPPVAAQITVNIFNWNLGIKNQIPQSRALLDLYQRVRKRTGELQVKSRFISLIRYLYIVGFLDTWRNRLSPNEVSEDIFFDFDHDVLECLESKSGTEELLKNLVERVFARCKKQNLFQNNSRNIFKHPQYTDGEVLSLQERFLFELPDLTASLQITHQDNGIRNRAMQSFMIVHTAECQQLMMRLATTLSFVRYMSLDWLGLSSGQKAFLNLFSKLTATLSRMSLASALLCIDEGDLYLHPKWQAEFLSSLITVLSAVSNVDVQLVLTSHSPLLVSDLPRQNIEILGSDGTIENDLETFGANLYDLYSGPLFLGELTSGLFAHSKIYHLFEIAKKIEKTRAESEYVQSFLRILGDKIFRFKLEEQTRTQDLD